MAGGTAREEGGFMKCEEAAEFASRLCDGQVIPREVAEHIGTCEACRTRLNAYAAIGAELRRVASLEQPISLKVVQWEKRERVRRRWWQEGRTTMRIPRFAFVSMLVLILILSGGLVVVRARAAQGEPMLLLHLTLIPNGKTGECWLTTNENPKTNQCGFATDVPRGGMVGLMFRFISRDGDRSQLGVKANYKESSVEFNFIDDFKDVPEKTISVDPEQQGRIQVPGLGEFEVTASYLNHPFTAWGRPDEAIEPRKDEFRVVAPVVIRGNEVICNLSANGYSIDDGDPDATLMIYYPGEGRYLISRVPFEGAVEGTVKNGQIRFTLDGEDYLLLSAAPILSAEHAWVSHDPQYKLSEHLEAASDGRPWFRVRSLKVLLQPQLGNID
jgi:hypothetical protein